MPQTRPNLTGAPAALFVFSNLREQKGGLTRAWLRRLSAFDAAGWDTHIATIHPQPEIDSTLAAWRERGWLPLSTQVHHYQRRDKRFRPSWSRRTDETFTRDDRVADWLDWLVGLLPGVVVFADSPVTYAPVAMMRNPFVGRVMTVHLAHRKGDPTPARGANLPKTDPAPAMERVTQPGAVPGPQSVPERGTESPAVPGTVPPAEGTEPGTGRRPRQIRSRYAGPVGQPRLSGRLLPYAPAADAVVALTERQAADLRADVTGLEVHVIPNMIDPIPEGLVPVRDPLLVVQLGRLDSVKRVDHAMRAVAIATRALPGLRLDVYGRGPELDHLVELRRELGLAGVVSFPGFTDDPVGVLAGSAASLMTSRREGFGLAVAESLAAGTPVVTYDVEYGPSELVKDGVNGRVVRDGSVEELAAALVEVVGDPATWTRMSLAAPAAAERLRPELVATQWLDLAADVAGRVELPVSALLVEDLRVRRAGLAVQGVRICRSRAEQVERLVLMGSDGVQVEVPLEVLGEADGAATEVAATLPWEAVATWREGAELTGRSAEGRVVPVHAPGMPVTVAPTFSGPVLVGWDEGDCVLRRLTGTQPVAVTARPTSVRAEVGQDVTVLSDLPIAAARILHSRGASAQVDLRLLPGLTLAADSVVAVGAGAGDHSVQVGEFRLAGANGDAPLGPGNVSGVIDWDAGGLTRLKAAGATPALVWLAVGRSLRTFAPVEIEPGRVLAVDAGGPWTLAPARTGRAMLVPGRGLRVRGSQVARRIVGKWTPSLTRGARRDSMGT